MQCHRLKGTFPLNMVFQSLCKGGVESFLKFSASIVNVFKRFLLFGDKLPSEQSLFDLGDFNGSLYAGW